MYSTRRIEHGLPLLADFDLGALMGARSGPEANLGGIMETMARAGKTRVIRRLSAVVNATEDQLRQAEADPKVLAALEDAAGDKPFAETFQDAVSFFVEWGNSLAGTPASLATVANLAVASGETAGSIPSGDS